MPASAQPSFGGTPDGGPAQDLAEAPTAESDTGLWIVQLDDPSLAGYTGGIDGLAATSPQVTGEDQLTVDAPAASPTSTT
jgi:hypothetical protein